MFFLPAELAKEAGNELLSHWMGNLGTSQDVSFTLCHVSQFSFLAGQCNSFFPPSHPLVSYCLEFILEVYQHFLVVFLPLVDSNFVIIVMLIEVSIKCCCIVVWQTKCIQCVRTGFSYEITGQSLLQVAGDQVKLDARVCSRFDCVRTRNILIFFLSRC